MIEKICVTFVITYTLETNHNQIIRSFICYRSNLGTLGQTYSCSKIRPYHYNL